MNTQPAVQTIVLDAAMPPDLECLLLTLDATRDQLRIHTRAVLLELLASRLSLPVSQLEMVISAGGKPCCPQAVAAGLTFSLSYAPPYALLVVGHGSRLGIDIERVVPSEPTWNLLEHVFTEAELQQWLRLPAGEPRCSAFTAAWTLKEAMLKALGTGLAEPPQSVSVTFSEDGQVTLAAASSTAWQRLNLASGHAAALVLLS